jgi:hypothetical protein
LREVAAMKTSNHVLEYIGYDVADIMYPRWIPTLRANRGTGRSWNSGTSASAAVTNQTVRVVSDPFSEVQTVSVRGYRNPVDFGGNTAVYRSAIADADTPDLPVPFDNVLTLYCVYRAYQQQEDAADGATSTIRSVIQGELDNLAGTL